MKKKKNEKQKNKSIPYKIYTYSIILPTINPKKKKSQSVNNLS